MATLPLVPVLAGPPEDDSGRLEPIGVQPVELANFHGGLCPGVMRQIGPAIGMAFACLVTRASHRLNLRRLARQR